MDSIFIQPRKHRRLPHLLQTDVLLQTFVFCHRFSSLQVGGQTILTDWRCVVRICATAFRAFIERPAAKIRVDTLVMYA